MLSKSIKKSLDSFYNSGNNINNGDYMKMCMLALEQKDAEFAYELVEKITRRSKYLVNNLKVRFS